MSDTPRAGGQTKGAMTEHPSQRSAGLALQSALNEYGNATQLTTLLAWGPRMLYVFSNGRTGSLRFSGRREGKALASAAKVGDIDARTCGRDEFSPVAEAETAQIVAETSGDLSAEIDAYMNHIIMRSRMSQVGAADRLPLSSALATFLVVAIVVVVDWFLNEPLVSRLGIAGYAVHVTSILIALASLVFAHYVVVGTPPGRRNRSRFFLTLLAVFGFLLFIVPGAYLRTTDAASAGEGDIAVGLDVVVPEATLGTVLIRLIPIGVMLGLMLFTTAVAALIALHNDTRKDQIRDSGSGNRMAALLTEAQVSTAHALQNKVLPLTKRLIGAHTASFNASAISGVEITAPKPAPLVELRATADAKETVVNDLSASPSVGQLHLTSPDAHRAAAHHLAEDQQPSAVQQVEQLPGTVETLTLTTPRTTTP